ncbi:MAG: hypothetical protein IT355_04940 [Gemmatimonadaceae bacterium]|nr:hypothetical protein [Gemmatimonadaceae bacterium]
MTATLRTLVVAGVLSLASPAMGQAPLVVTPIQNLSFGALLPNVRTVVDALQLTRSGQIRVQASIGAVFEVRYTLPAAMTSGTSSVPLVFGTSAAGAAASGTPASLQRFNPNVAARFRFVTTDRATLFLGGEARPRLGQATGTYSAPIIVTITNLGI